MYSSAGEGNPAEMRWRSSGNSQTAGLLAAGCKKGRTAADVPGGVNRIRVVIFEDSWCWISGEYKVQIGRITIEIQQTQDTSGKMYLRYAVSIASAHIYYK